MAEAQNTGGRTPRKAAARKAPTPARTAVQPGAVEDAAAAAAAVRPSPQRASARAAAAMRGEPEPDVTVVVEPEQDDEVEEIASIVPFQGRNVAVKSPTAEQLAIYRRLSVQFQALAQRSDANSLPMEEALRHLDRAVRLVQSVLVRAEDREWIEDGLLDGVVTLDQCLDLLRAAFRALNDKAAQQQGSGNRAERRSRARLED